MPNVKTDPTSAAQTPRATQPGPEQFAALYNESRDDLFSYLAYLTADRDLAEELTAAAFERAFRKRGLFRARRGDLRGWLFSIARNLAIDALRVRPREGALELLGELGGGVDESAQADNRLELAEAMRRLQPRERELIALKFFAGLENGEISSVLKISRSNVGTQLHRAMERLRAELINRADQGVQDEN